jgi:replicative DNA helicase
MGIRRKELVLIAAPPGRAKTALALQIADQTAAESLAYWQTECERRKSADPSRKSMTRWRCSRWRWRMIRC